MAIDDGESDAGFVPSSGLGDEGGGPKNVGVAIREGALWRASDPDGRSPKPGALWASSRMKNTADELRIRGRTDGSRVRIGSSPVRPVDPWSGPVEEGRGRAGTALAQCAAAAAAAA